MSQTNFQTILLTGTLLVATPFLFADGAHFDDRGQVIFSDDFSGPTLAQGWAGKPGKWEMVDGAAKVSELAEDKHAAVRRHPLQYHDAIFELSFEFDGAKVVALSINNKGGHVCRLIATPNGMTLQVDQPNHDSELKAVKLASSTAKIAPGAWHKMVVEVRGPRMIAQIDDGPAITGENPRVDVEKTDLGIPVSGVSARIKGLKVYAVK
jgi:hypothetical protein